MAGGESWHSFSFGSHYDPANTHFGPLLASNEDRLVPGGGYEPHPHRDVEIVTWVLSGSLVHRDDSGRETVVRTGEAQLISAGSGVVHSELAGPDEPVHLVQMWVAPDERGLEPSHGQLAVDPGSPGGALIPIASGLDVHAASGALHLHNRGAGLSVGRLAAGESVELPHAPLVHVFVARGAATVQTGQTAQTDRPVQVGDAIRLAGAGRVLLTATEPAELLVWQMHTRAQN